MWTKLSVTCGWFLWTCWRTASPILWAALTLSHGSTCIQKFCQPFRSWYTSHSTRYTPQEIHCQPGLPSFWGCSCWPLLSQACICYCETVGCFPFSKRGGAKVEQFNLPDVQSLPNKIHRQSIDIYCSSSQLWSLKLSFSNKSNGQLNQQMELPSSVS